MGINRAADYKWDKENPRTRRRLVASGEISVKTTYFISLVFATILIFSSFKLNFETGVLSPLLLLVLGSYSYLKRYTFCCHIYLGFCLALSPIAVSIALSQAIGFNLILLSLAITCWITAFDILYALQDLDFDLSSKLKSIPVKFGLNRSLSISLILQVSALFFFFYWLKFK